MADLSSELEPGEEMVVRARMHPIAFAGTVGFAAFVVGAAWLIVVRNELAGSTILQLWLAALGIVLIGFVSPVIRWRNAECLVTTRRVLLRAGLFRPRTLALRLPAIEDVGVEQSFGGRLLDYGTLQIVGSDGAVDVFAKVRCAQGVREAVLRQTRGTSGRRR
jgi:uncharacterized membrane protein YdbT with pleckstrin-like domain